MKKSTIITVITKGIAHLVHLQKRDGGFLSWSSPNQELFIQKKIYHTTFTTSLILLALTGMEETAQIKKLKEKATNFLLAQKSAQWSWNYWARGSLEAKTMPYPDDLDDTFCALAALSLAAPHLIDGTTFASVVKLLTATEVKEGGPYKTWLVDKYTAKNWHDVDIVVNSNIAYFLSLHDITLPNLQRFLTSQITKENFTSPYYCSPFPLLYFLSRFVQGQNKKKIKQFLLRQQQQDGSWGNPLYSALAISSLLNLGVSPTGCTQGIRFLLNNQSQGLFKPYGFCFDPAFEGTSYICGSSALTTVYCLEALAKYERATHPKQVGQNLDAEDALYDVILAKVKNRFHNFDKTFQQYAYTFLDQMLAKKTGRQIPLLPYYFSLSLDHKKNSVTQELLVSLGTANVFGWIAYTIYDDFLDEEGNPQLLSVANLCLRELTTLFNTILPTTTFKSYYTKLVDQLDNANLWELTNCRMKIEKKSFDLAALKIPNYKSYKHLAYKSLGHALGPIAILFSLGYTQKTPEVQNTLRFFMHYLIARQLNDDAHDWGKDLQKGHINAASALLFKRYILIEKSIHQRVLLKNLIPQLQTIFWYDVVTDICKLTMYHTKNAKQFLKKVPIIVNPTPLENLVTQYEDSVAFTLRERKHAKQFIKQYGQ
ncbi:MAG TPA: hypothetical protein VE090_04255 [Methylomirabilota bacterium]|nr:hypothetical protein [Methylomirabilota bacterium]